MNHNLFVDAADYVPLFKELPPVVKHTVISGTIRFAAGAAIGLAIGQNPLATGLLWAITNVASIALQELHRSFAPLVDSDLHPFYNFLIGYIDWALVCVACAISILVLHELNMITAPMDSFIFLIMFDFSLDSLVTLKTTIIDKIKNEEF